MLDFLIRGGLVVDGMGTPLYESHVGIKGDRIVFMGSGEPAAAQVIDAGGLIVAPGFIDTHSHSEFTLLADGRAEGKICQGVTTEISGNCGLSAAPLLGEAMQRREEDLRELGIAERWSTFTQYFSLLESRGISLNFATLCGHGNIRGSVMGYRNRRPDPGDMTRMKSLLAEALRDGAKGLSTGLIYPPGVYAETEELVALAQGLSDVPCGIYASHMRSEGDALIEAIGEVVTIGRRARIPVHVSHLKTSGEQNWWKRQDAIACIEEARRSGVQVTCDRYPYVAASTDLDTVLPSWAYEGGTDEELRRLTDPLTRKEILADVQPEGSPYWKNVVVSSVTTEERAWMEGRSVADIAGAEKKSVHTALIDLLVAERTRVGAIFFSMSEENLLHFLRLPYLMIGSDSSARSFSGPTRRGKPHPRGFGSFPRFLARYAREKSLLPIEEAVRRMTSLPADTFGLRDRGRLQAGMFADLTVFDRDKLSDRATFSDPFQKPDGIVAVFVNGAPVVRDGEPTGARPGRVLRSSHG